MSKRQRTTKRMLNSDLITELPEVVLSKIISLLPLREAIRTSILSKNWKRIWTNHPDLLLDPIDVLGSSCGTSLYLSKFIKTVNHVMFQRSKGLKMNSIAVHFPLGRKNACHISQWISCAVTKGVEKIDLDLSDEVCNFSPEDSEPLCWLFPAPRKAFSTVKHLRLTSCSISSFPFSKNLTSLVTVDLQCVRITDKRLEDLQRTCLSIERMVLHSCDYLVKFKLRNPSSRIKFLSIQNCSRIKDINLHARNLEVFEYTGHLPLFSFKDVDKLSEVFLCFTGNGGLGGITYALNRIAYDLPQLKTLNVTSIQAITEFKLPEKVPAFGNIQRLVLSVYPFRDEDKLCWISYILKAFPMLSKLELNLFSPVFFITKLAERTDRQLPECYHQHLKELEINGYYGNKHEFFLLKYLVDSAVQLDVLAISPCQKVYKGFDNWGTEETPGYVLETDRILQLHEVVPETVQLKIL